MVPVVEDNTVTEEANEALHYDFLSDYEICNSDLNLPYHHKLKKALDVKNNIFISGFIPSNAEKFSIDLLSNKKNHNIKTKEVVFHFNPRFNQNCVVRNSYIDGEWGTEEVHAIKKNPFVRGQTFFMEIFVTVAEYLVSVNGVHFCGYVHRIPPSYVDSIDISGHVKLIKVELSKREFYPSSEKTVFLMDDLSKTRSGRFFHEFKYPLMIGWDLSIYGSILENAERFAVDLLNTSEKFEDRRRNIAFHLNPRINQRYIVRNSFIRGEWGVEECHAIRRSPLQRGKLFLLEIFAIEKEYMVSVNGNHFCSFQHRLPIFAIDSLEIHGDISLLKVDICLRENYPLPFETLYPDLSQLNEKICQPVRHFLDHPLKMDSSVIEIKGRVLLLPSEFFINLQYGKTNFPHPIIPFHLSMRWHPDGDNSTVLNSWTKDRWDEEFVLFSLLRPNSNFTITIYIKREGFSTVVKAPIKPYSTVLPLFAHRSELSIINNIYIQGDVQIYSIEVKNN